jgi:hypothetical protein
MSGGAWATVRLDLQDAQRQVVDLERAVDEFAGKDVKIEVEQVQGETTATAPAVARVGREVDRAEYDELKKLLRLRALRRARARRVRARTAARTAEVSAERIGVRESAGLAARATPWGLIIGAVVVGAVVADRLITGTPLEGTAAAINSTLLGDEDDKARAARRTREWLGASPLAAEIGRREGISQQISEVAEVQRTLFLREEKGLSQIREAFPVNSTLDLIIVGVANALKKAWSAEGGESSLGKLGETFRKWVGDQDAMGVRILKGFLREWVRGSLHV